ncbi:glutaminase kidney isoform, mitochondrial-like [Sinocyclocheilus grahami]|uniref:glutaminase kidney isoform, mitochondrial-like n=1 Tax=Sinocyclocheilus grahami TaxID=75366 RepID=UPI0007AD50A2|nr:PREDICTED: glutaminase kidney isoform, mitochondrial-like [Sinocyclocheilus grahami]
MCYLGMQTSNRRLRDVRVLRTLRLTNVGVIGSLAKHIAKSSSACHNVLRKTFSLSSKIHASQELIAPASAEQPTSKKYIPHLTKFSPDLWGVSLCTVDGQRHSVGDTKVPFCLQSCVKPLEYAIAVHEHGTERVHHYVGKEPSGFKFNKLSLDEEDKPHNPMVNAGAIVISSLIKPGVNKAEKFDYVGLPAKSGVSGAVLLVVPNVMGVMCWSPPVDKVGNSVRGIHFCQELVSLFNFHNYDNLRHFLKKQDPRRLSDDDRNKSVVNLMFAAHSGDVSALRRFALSSMDMDLKDYDSRTPLHVAAAEGHMDVVLFLMQSCRVNPFVKDRWGNIPRDDAMQFGHEDLVKILEEYEQKYIQTSQTDAEDRSHQSKCSSLEGRV